MNNYHVTVDLVTINYTIMMQTIALKSNELFGEISSGESAAISGGQYSSYALGATALAAGLFTGLLVFGIGSLMSEAQNSMAGSLAQI